MLDISELLAKENDLDYYDELMRLRGIDRSEPDFEGRFVKGEAVKESGMDIPYGKGPLRKKMKKKEKKNNGNDKMPAGPCQGSGRE